MRSLALTAFGESVNGLSEVFTLQDKISLERMLRTEESGEICRLDIMPTGSAGESFIAGLPYVDVIVEDPGLADSEGRTVVSCTPADRSSFWDEVTLLIFIQPEGSKQPDELRVYYEACA